MGGCLELYVNGEEVKDCRRRRPLFNEEVYENRPKNKKAFPKPSKHTYSKRNLSKWFLSLFINGDLKFQKKVLNNGLISEKNTFQIY